MVFEEYEILVCNAMHPREGLTFQRNVGTPSSGSKRKPSKKSTEVGGKLSSFLARFIHWLWRWRRCVPQKFQAFFKQHSVTTQKTVLFVVSTVRTSNPEHCVQWEFIESVSIIYCDRNEWSAPHSSGIPLRKDLLILIVFVVLGGPKSHSRCSSKQENLAPIRSWTLVVQLIGSHFIDWLPNINLETAKIFLSFHIHVDWPEPVWQYVWVK
jgi:hypothetical protein